MDEKEPNTIGARQGCLMVEQTAEGERILFADGQARAILGLDSREPASLSPREATAGIPVAVRPLDGERALWILGPGGEDAAALAREKRELELALREAQESNRAKSRFLSQMSHDIRTPMNAIVGMTSIALSHIDEKARVQDCLQKIKTASAHLMDLVNDVLDMSRIDSGRMNIGHEPFSLADLVHDTAVILRPQAAQKGQTLHIDIGEILEEDLVGDALRLRQILVNIIGNAVKYTQNGGEILVNFSQRPGAEGTVWLDFSCRDNGMGMSQDFLTHTFEPFSRVNNAAINKIEGTGLGMAIVKRIVDSMDGSLHVESEEGAGSLFTVALPLPVAPRREASPLLPRDGTVLVAEGDDARAAQMSEYLRQSGLEVVRTATGLETVTWLTEAQYEGRLPCASGSWRPSRIFSTIWTSSGTWRSRRRSGGWCGSLPWAAGCSTTWVRSM